MENRNFYIEYRVYLQDGAFVAEVMEDAEILKDELITLLDDEFSSKVFTKDVTYEVKREIRKEKD